MDSQPLRPRYHVVCRECRVERLVDGRDAAVAAEREHAKETGHRVVAERV
ncbi:hypothetical protein [Halorubrum trueperi]|uniref:DUF1059 domain-containing protein n=1 Tax=Halorubrum trueperi TaxID=2004704 RepID=A0ABD5USI3_9EURY